MKNEEKQKTKNLQLARFLAAEDGNGPMKLGGGELAERVAQRDELLQRSRVLQRGAAHHTQHLHTARGGGRDHSEAARASVAIIRGKEEEIN